MLSGPDASSAAFIPVRRAARVTQLVFGIALSLLGASASAGVYKCETASGQIAYQATPCEQTSTQSELKIQNTRSSTPAKTRATPDRALGQGLPEYRIHFMADEPAIAFWQGELWGVPIALPTAKRTIVNRKQDLARAEQCDVTRKKNIAERKKRREETLQKARAACERKPHSHCDSGDPDKIIALYETRNNAYLDVPNDPDEYRRRVIQMAGAKRRDELYNQHSRCPEKRTRDYWQQEIERHQKAVMLMEKALAERNEAPPQ